MKKTIQYKDGYKHQGQGDHCYLSRLRPIRNIDESFYSITKEGWVWGYHGYAWDGASGPTKDSLWTKRASYFHDIGCQAIGEGLLDPEDRAEVDQMFYDILLIDLEADNPKPILKRLRKIRAWYWYRGVRLGAKTSKLDPTTYHITITAPDYE